MKADCEELAEGRKVFVMLGKNLGPSWTETEEGASKRWCAKKRAHHKET